MLLSLSSTYLSKSSPLQRSAQRGERRSFQKNTLVVALSVALAGGAQAVGITWTGAESAAFDAANNWDPAHSGTIFSDSVYVNGAGISPLLEGSAAFDWLSFQNGLLVGTGTGANGSLGMKDDPAHQRLTLTIDGSSSGLEPDFRIGDAGGVGSVNIDLTAPPQNSQTYPRVFITNQGLAVGTEGTGTLTVKGTGVASNPITGDDANLAGFVQASTNGLIGRGAAGNGTLNLDGAGLVYMSNYWTNPSDTVDTVPTVAVGVAGGTGRVDILHGGKLGVADSTMTDPLATVLTRGFIGKGGGIGTVTMRDPAGSVRNIAQFAGGLVVGSGGGQGTLDVLGAGKVSISNGASSSACVNAVAAPAALQIGGTGVGLVKMNGSGANLLVSGRYVEADGPPPNPQKNIHDHHIGQIQIGNDGKLVTADQASIKVGTAQIWNFGGAYVDGIPLTYETYGIGPVNVEGSGAVYFGSETSVPTAPGSIDASLIYLADSASGLHFNHSGNLSFNLPLKGQGQLVQEAGTTSMAQVNALPVFPVNSSCAPTIEHPNDQLAFTGPVEVRGGTLVLPTDDVLSNAQSFTVTGGTLMQGGTNQTLNQVTLDANGSLQLTDSGQSTSDVSKAVSWSGGGSVLLDTVLGACGSASDKLVITGAITGETRLKINNVNGLGAATNGCDGILVVEASAASGVGTFVLDGGPITQGGYQYQLVKAGNGSWYLQSTEAPGTIIVQQTVTPSGGTPAFNGSIPFTLNCTAPSYQYSGNITVTNNTGTSAPITVAAGSQCAAAQGASMPGVTGYKWEAPAYGPSGTAMPMGGSQMLTISNSLIKAGSSGGNNGGTNVMPVPVLGAGGLGALVGLMMAAAGFMGRRRKQT